MLRFILCILMCTNVVSRELYWPESQEVKDRTWVTITTLPERLSNPWFAKTLNRTITMCSRLGATLLLQVPPHTRHSNRPYMIPQYILKLQSAAFQVSLVNVDEGPITKILPALRDPRIKDDDTIVVYDDDIVYRENVFKWLSDNVKKHPNAVSCMCSRRIAGFKGFAFQKRVFKELANIRQPPSCFRIDDDVIREFARHRNIGRVAVPYNNDTWWTCSMYQGQTDTHPRWPELAHDDRKPMQDKCIREFRQELLFRWARDNGAYIHKCLTFRDGGMYATCDIPARTMITAVPWRLALKPKRVKPKRASDWVGMAEQLLDRGFLKIPSSLFISGLPTSCQQPKCNLNISQLTLLGVKRIRAKVPDGFYTWSTEKQIAYSVVKTRTTPVGMVPVNDLWNHNSHRGDVQRRNETHNLQFTLNAVVAGEQIYQRYGKFKSQMYVYENYGFVDPNVVATCDDARLLRGTIPPETRIACLANSTASAADMRAELIEARRIGDSVMVEGIHQWFKRNT